MYRSILLFFLFGFSLVQGFGQYNDIPVHYFLTTEDYVANRRSPEMVYLEVRAQGPEFIQIKDVIDPGTQKSSRDGRRAWAFEYDGALYINLLYSVNSPANGLFVKQDILGRFCLAVMEEDFIQAHNKASPSTYGGGLTGVILNDSGMWGGGFFDSLGMKRKIFIADTKHLTVDIPYKGKSAHIELLSSSTLKWLTGKENYKGRKWEYTVEEIVALIEDLNRRQ